MRTVDLRSDTITEPTAAMREAMARAEVGDDVYGEDPTVNRLEALATERLGKEAALFVASGTMGNLVSLLTHCGRGDEVILGDLSHTYLYEQGGMATLGGIHPRVIPNQPDGTLALEEIKAAVNLDNIHFPRSRLIALENTHNRCGGIPLDVDYMKAVGGLARANGLKVHLDGARIFNASVALKVDAAELAAEGDSITICLSKGLCAPVGSIVCGSREFIIEARRARKVLGGGMRQAGILAAAGIVALTEMVDRLKEDHDNAKRLARGLADIKGITIDLDRIRTNIVIFDISRKGMSAFELSENLKSRGVLMLPRNDHSIRAVTNFHVTAEDIDYALRCIAESV